MQRIVKASYRWNAVIGGIGGFLILGAMVLVVSDVIGRFFLNRPIKGAVEIESIILCFIAFMSIAYGLTRNSHLRVMLLTSRFSGRVRLRLDIFTDVLGIFFFGFLTQGALWLFWDSWVTQELMPAAIDIPFWISKLTLSLGSFLMTLQFVIHLLDNVKVAKQSAKKK